MCAMQHVAECKEFVDLEESGPDQRFFEHFLSPDLRSAIVDAVIAEKIRDVNGGGLPGNFTLSRSRCLRCQIFQTLPIEKKTCMICQRQV